MNLTGKWKYFENYAYGVAEGELYLDQSDDVLSGKIVFTDKIRGEKPYMIQEFLIGEIDEQRIRIEAVEFDVIHAEQQIDYELDRWFGILINDVTIRGVSSDEQGISGYFEFTKVG